GRPELEPLVEAPLVEQMRLEVEQILDLAPRRGRRSERPADIGRRHTDTGSPARSWSCHLRQNCRICSAPDVPRSSSQYPREGMPHGTPDDARSWHDASAATSSGVARPPGPAKVT